MKTIKLTRGLESKVDDEDYDKLNSHKWFAFPKRGKFHAARVEYEKSEYKRTVFMHREVLSLTSSDGVVDHINGDSLDNRKENLRECTVQQNNMNKGKYKTNKSGYKNVIKRYKSRKGQAWCAQIVHDGKTEHIGIFYTPEEAALAYNKRAIEIFGEFANLNVIKT